MRYVAVNIASSPISFGNRHLKKKSSNHFKKMTIFPFCNPVLLKGVYTCPFMSNTIIDIFCAIIRPYFFNIFSKLILDKMKKINKELKNFRFTFHKIWPCDTSTIINKSNKPFSSRNIF
ncbi:hypothetical protein Fmac_020476 [Flemingia macrophylla]|uniref:Uncharacterized protein n=1 Tax=Flemingia macrophylla TaxID=520843 RepID=A0ABD1LU53_9FABA